MAKYKIIGGNTLSGKIHIESAKNSVLALLAGAFLTDEEVIINNCPKIQDVLSMLEILSYLGVKCLFQEDKLIINARHKKGFCVPKILTEKLRSSTYMMGSLLSIYKKAQIYYPGGCNIGKRPIDLHLYAFKKLGALVQIEDEMIKLDKHDDKGGIVIFSFASVGATINTILSAVLLDGKTVIYNCAKEPEIVDLANFLNSMGARISGAGGSRIEIEGVKKLHGTTYTPICDRIELGTYILAGAINGGEIEFYNAKIKNIEILTHKISNISCKITSNNDIIYTKFKGKLNSFNIETGPFPKFPTDLQPQAMVYLCYGNGLSLVRETLFESRFNHVNDLIKMGADITVNGKVAIVNGVGKLTGAKVRAGDLRGGASLVLAGLNAEGTTIVEDCFHIERGYLNMVEKLSSLGANVTKEQ